MTITYHGHSCFKIKGARGTVVTDPYSAYIGFGMPTLSGDMVTVSHNHDDHNAYAEIKGTARTAKPFLINKPGEYEVGGISVFGIKTFHDGVQGTERGTNTVYKIFMDNLTVCHLGDLGHELTPDQIEDLGEIDVLLCPVGGHFTVNSEQAVKLIHSIEPSIVIPMHYRTDKHNSDVFADVQPLESFLKEYGAETTPQKKLDITKQNLPEETELVLLMETFKE